MAKLKKAMKLIGIIFLGLFLCGFKGQYEDRRRINFNEMLDIEIPMLVNGAMGFNLSNETNIINYKCVVKPSEYLYLYFNDKGDFTFKKCGTGFFGWLCRLTKGRYFLVETEYEVMDTSIYNDTISFPFEVESGNGISYNPEEVRYVNVSGREYMINETYAYIIANENMIMGMER